MSSPDHRYLLSVWRGNDDEPARATLRDVNDGRVMSFEDLGRMLAFLEAAALWTNASDAAGSHTSHERGDPDAQDLPE